MRKAAAGLAVMALLLGWCLGWVSHERWGPERQAPRAPVSTERSAPMPAHPVAAAGAERNDAIGQLLDRKAFARAMERYQALQAQADDTAVQRATDRLLAHARELIMQADYPSAVQLLQLYLQAAYRDVEARMLLADAYRGEKDWRAAIEQLYESKGQAYRPETLDQLTRRIRAVVAEYADVLRRRGDNTGLLELYQDLTQLEPSYAAYFIGLASAQLALEDKVGARQSLLLVAQDPEVGAQARELLERLRVAAAERQPAETSASATAVAGIPLVRSGSHFLVDARVGNAQRARLLIDTGASLTVLTPEAMRQRSVGAHATGRSGSFNTANGRVRAPIYRLDRLSVGDWQVSDLEVGVLELGDTGIDGLLGMNFLGRFQFFIDQNEGLLRLSAAAEAR